jgi:hypothetical protein
MAARSIPSEMQRELSPALSIQKALGYLVDEKLLHHVEAPETRPAFAETLPQFVAAVRELFQPHVLREYLDSLKRVGAQGHALDDETFELARGMFQEDAVSAAVNVVRMGRIREMLIG